MTFHFLLLGCLNFSLHLVRSLTTSFNVWFLDTDFYYFCFGEVRDEGCQESDDGRKKGLTWSS